MSWTADRVMFDQEDHELLAIVNDALGRGHSRKSFKSLFVPFLHPNGIKEMAAPKALRIAYAMIHLLDMLEVGGAMERLTALRSVRNEVLHCARSALRLNTGRVLLQIMKELVRAHGDNPRQLELAHDFRTAASGKPLIIRERLRRYHLLEMPEEWNQLAFDDHVHDANTKGRKSPTHLIMDAWIKGIRSLTVIYYNYLRPEVAAELLEASDIMGLKIRIGLEFPARFRGRYVRLIWEPRGFSSPREILRFLDQSDVKSLMAEGRAVSEYQKETILDLLEDFNKNRRPMVDRDFGIRTAPLDTIEFLAFVGPGLPSRLHLAELAHRKIVAAMRPRVEEIERELPTASPEEASRLNALLEEMDALDAEAVLERYIGEGGAMDKVELIPADETAELPGLLLSSPCELVETLTKLYASCRITLNLSGLRPDDVLELLYECQGKITHLELFNLKDHAAGKTDNIQEINELQLAINHGNVIQLKKTIRRIMARLEASSQSADAARLQKFHEILRNIGTFQQYYRGALLRTRIGSDSTGRSTTVPGMGLAVRETLPGRTLRYLRSEGDGRRNIPIRVRPCLTVVRYSTQGAAPWLSRLSRLVGRIPGFRFFGMAGREEWTIDQASIVMERPGNVISLSGARGRWSNGLRSGADAGKARSEPGFNWRFLNSGVKNALKILIGFIPAFLTFYLTKEWWLLAYLGAVIWFGITGVRNVIQSVLGGGGLRRSPLLTWKDYVNWDRLSDSLFYTGFSVPLLDWLVKSVLLDGVFNINTANNPIMLYSFIALANGIYISSHNAYRGLPRGAIVGNFFRSLLSIPLALAFNAIAGGLLAHYGVAGVNDHLQKWAAIISKAASDCVAGVIEGLADRAHNLAMRLRDYTGKLEQVYRTFTRLELLFPEEDIAEVLRDPKQFMRMVEDRDPELGKIFIINALDLQYFWMYQPRARSALKTLAGEMSGEERLVLERSQSALRRNREVSRMFVDGLVGKRFSKALSFYLDREEEYLEAMRKLLDRPGSTETEDGSPIADSLAARISARPATDRIGV